MSFTEKDTFCKGNHLVRNKRDHKVFHLQIEEKQPSDIFKMVVFFATKERIFSKLKGLIGLMSNYKIVRMR